MPDPPHSKAHQHPYARSTIERHKLAERRHSTTRYAELAVTTNFTFLRGASHPDEYVHQAACLGYEAVAVTDHNSLAGIVRAHVAAKDAGIPLVVGCRLTFTDLDGLSLLVYPTDRASYGRLCTLLTIGKRRAPKGECRLTLDDLITHAEGLLGILLPSHRKLLPDVCGPSDAIGRGSTVSGASTASLRARLGSAEGAPDLCRLRDAFDGDRLSVAVCRRYESRDRERLVHGEELAKQLCVPLVVVQDAYYHVAERRPLQDVLTCVRHGCTIDEAGFRLISNGERYLKPVADIARLWSDHPQALTRTIEIAERARSFSLAQLRYEYAEETCPSGVTPMAHLRALTWEGAKERYPHGVPEKVCSTIEHEFALIAQLNYAPYFLTVHDLVAFARSQGILCQGRGAAANSAVCFCLGVTSVDPDRIDLLFERFVSVERNEPPDIDIDFEHERREEVIQYLYNKYGRDRAGLTAEVISYRRRSAIRDVGKALGFSLDAVDRIAKRVDRWEKNPFADCESGDVPAQLDALGFDSSDATIRLFVQLVRELLGFPRHLSQHVGGFVITRGPLSELVPIENAAMPDRTVIEWDKDDIDALGILKVDVLGLGMLTCIRKGLEFINSHEATKPRSHEGMRWPGHEVKGEFRDDHQDISRLDRLAKGDGACSNGVHSHSVDAEQREVRPHFADEKSGRIDSIQHCGGTWSPESARLYSVSQNLSGVAHGIADTIASLREPRVSSDFNGTPGVTSRNGSSSSRIDPKFGETTALISDSPCCSSPPWLRGSVAPWLTLATIPAEDPAVYDMLCNADSVGVFQVESRAQMTMLPRLKPRCFYDLVIEVAIVRPGPIVGEMVHPYLRRRNGEEPVPDHGATIHGVLGKTLGVPLFQEQVMALAIKAAGFTPGEAEKLRRAITAWTSKADIAEFPARFVGGMVRNGYSREFAEWCFQRFKGFSQYGFPESHSASFALLVYASAWIKCHYPAVFAAALLNSQPLGFYAPAQIVRDAQEHGVVVRPLDVNHSAWDCTLEDSHEATEPRSHEEERHGKEKRALRLGLRMVKGLRRVDADAIVEAVRRFGSFVSIFDLWRASEVSASALRVLAQADAFHSMGLDRQRALWEVHALHGKSLPLFDGLPDRRDTAAKLPSVLPMDEVTRDYCAVGLSLKAHPVSFLRPMLKARRVITAAEAKDERLAPFGLIVAVAGIVLFRQRPGTAKGVMFMTIEDETGRMDLIVRPDVYERFRDAAVYAKLIVARGRVERREKVVHLLSLAFEDLERLSENLPRLSRDFR